MTREDALSLAIDLFRAPTLRHAARAQPVPVHTRELLQLATGQPARLAEASAHTGVDAADLLEASRFFVREVLLYPDADDYRVLGLRPGADLDSLKTHYRLLLAWLHPDRVQSEAEQAFAARVNAAWNRLRAAPQDAPADPAPPPAVTPPSAFAPRWIRLDPEDTTRPRRHIVLPVLLLALCALLLWVATRPPPAPDAARPGTTAAADASLFDGLVLQPKTDDQAPAPAPAPAIAAAPRADAPAPAPAPSPARAAAPATPVALPAVSTPARAITAPAARTPGAATGSAPEASTAARAPAAPLAITAATTSAPAAQQASRRMPAPAPTPAATVPTATSASTPENAAHASTAHVTALASDEDTPIPTATATPRHPELAGERLDALLAFVTRPQTIPPPIWRNVQAMDEAERIRGMLLAHGSAGAPTIQAAHARWTHRPDRAFAVVPVVWPAPDARVQRLHAELTWRDDDWRIESLLLEDPAR